MRCSDNKFEFMETQMIRFAVAEKTDYRQNATMHYITYFAFECQQNISESINPPTF